MLDIIMNDGATKQPAPLPVEPADHPLYQTVETLMRQGRWQAIQTPLKELLGLYPNDPYLQYLTASARARSALLESDQEVIIVPARQPIINRSLKFIIPGFGLLIVLGLTIGLYLIFQAWILPEVRSRRQEAQLNQLQEEAQTALVNGDYNRAILAYNELLQLRPEDQSAQQGLQQANELRAIVSLYSEAVVEMEAHRWENALALLREIETKQPGYRDVPARIKFVQEQQDLLKRFNEAEAAFNQGNYALAAQEYEVLQAAGYNFQREKMQDQLFLSYLQLGLAVEAAAGSDPQKLQEALDQLEKALALRPKDARARGEGQLIKSYLSGLEEFKAKKWSPAIANFSLVYETRPDFADGVLTQNLYQAHTAWGDELQANDQAEEALAQYEAAGLIKGVNAADLEQKIASAQQALATPTPEPAATPTAAAAPAPAGGAAAAPRPLPTPTPRPLPYVLKGLSIRNNCDGFGYIHGIVWSTYNLPLTGVVVQAFNTTTGLGPLAANPTNADGVYQIILNQEQIEGLWMVQVLEANGQPASEPWGQRLGGGCQNGAQELKVDWQYILQTN